MINNVVLTGRLTKEPELRYTQSGVAVANFTLAVNRNFKNQQGETEADFIMCQIWRKQAEALANYTHKGSLIGIEGRIQTRNYDNQQGQRVYVTEVIADRFTFLESRQSGGQQQGQGYQQQGQGQQPAQGYQGQGSQYQQPADPWQAQAVPVQDNDLPF